MRKKGSSKFELILFYHAGWKPKEIIEKGYTRSTSYAYFRHYKKAIEIFKSKK